MYLPIIPTLWAGIYTLCVLTCTNNECHLFSGKTKLDCVSTNNILVESFEFLMEYFMTFCIRKSDGETGKQFHTASSPQLFGNH